MVDGAPKFGLICWTCLGRVQSAIPHDFGFELFSLFQFLIP